MLTILSIYMSLNAGTMIEPMFNGMISKRVHNLNILK